MRKTYYLTRSGTLKRKDNSLILTYINGNKVNIPIESVDTIFVLADVTFNSDLVEFLSRRSIVVHFFDYYGNYSSTLWPKEKNVSGSLLVRQVQSYLNGEERLHIAKKIVESSLSNLKINATDLAVPKESIEHMESISDLMLLEGRVRKEYFSSFKKTLKSSVYSGKRTRRPPEDPFNALISFGYSLLYSTTLSEIAKTPLDPKISYLHEPFNNRFSLTLDISEIFKPLIVDRLCLRLINKKMISKKDFRFEGGVYLNEDARRLYLQKYNEAISTTLKHRKLNREVTYKYLIRLECYKIMRYLLEGASLSFFEYTKRW